MAWPLPGHFVGRGINRVGAERRARKRRRLASGAEGRTGTSCTDHFGGRGQPQALEAREAGGQKSGRGNSTSSPRANVAHVNKRIGRKVDAYLEWKHSGESKHERNEGFAVVAGAGTHLNGRCSFEAILVGEEVVYGDKRGLRSEHEKLQRAHGGCLGVKCR